MEMKAIFSKTLCELREAKGKEYTRQKVANDLNISRASLEYYEKGQRLPDIEIAAKIADYYNVSVDYLLGRSKSQSNDKELTAVADYLGVSDWAVMLIREYSGKIEEDTSIDYLWEQHKQGKRRGLTGLELENSFNASQSDICDWIISNLFSEAYKTISALLSDMYKMEKYDNESDFDLSDKAYIFLNRLTDRYKYKIDKLLMECSKPAEHFSYISIYESDLGNIEEWYCGSFRNINKVDKYVRDNKKDDIRIEIDENNVMNIIGDSTSDKFKEIVRILKEEIEKQKAGD